MFRALNRRDAFASPSNRWADPRARLLDGKRWEARALSAAQHEHDLLDEDVARLSPLRHGNLIVLGRYSFRASTRRWLPAPTARPGRRQPR